MTTVTEEQQRRLLDLQALDEAIRRLRYRRAHLPEQQALDERAGLLEKVTADHLTASDELVSATRRQARLEQEVGSVDARRRSEERRMYSGLITSEREATALRHEIGALKDRKRGLEDELLEVMERHEELTSSVATLEARKDELTAEVTPLREARDAAATDIDAELARRRAERGQLAGRLPDRLIERYDQIRARKDGLAVVELVGRTCQGCHIELTPAELEEGREIGVLGIPRCLQCGRLLVGASDA